jgi:hypothetical protein
VRLASALVLLLLAGNASSQEARRAMFVRYPHNGTTGGAFVEQVNIRNIIGAFERAGIAVDQYRMEQVKTEWLRRAHFPVGADQGNTSRQGVRQYDMVYLYGYRVGVSVSNIYGGTVNADSLTRAASWPDKPTIFQACIGVPNASMMTSTATCTTGVTANLSGAFPAGQPTNLMCAFIPGTDIEFDTFSATQGWQLNYANHDATHGAGTLVPLVGYASTGNIDVASASDYDGPIPGTNIARPDTAIAWERRRSSAETAPIIFTQASASGGTPIVNLPAIAIARADAANATPLTGTALGWKPNRFAIGVHAIGHHSDNNTAGMAGVPCWSGKCDTTNFKRTLIDSLGPLAQRRGAKLSLGFNAGVRGDTASTYPNEVEWIKSLPAGTYKVYPWNIAGISTSTGSKSGNGDDVWGRTRSNRTWWSAASGVPPYSCDDADTSIYCQLKRENQTIFNLFGHVMGFRYAPDSDYIPQGYSRRMMPDPDTAGTAMWAAGIRVVAFNAEERTASPSLTTAPSASGTPQPEVSNKIWYGAADGMRLRGWLPGMSERGHVLAVAERGNETEVTVSPSSSTHPHEAEFFQGTLAPVWYHPDPWPYYHNFRTRLSFFSASAASFTSNAQPNQNLGWWQLKWIINQVSAVNYYSPKKVVEIVFADEL